MLTLLKIEWLKVKKYKPVWIILIFLLILFPVTTIAFGKFFESLTDGTGVKQFLTNPFDFPTVFLSAAYINNGLNIAWGMLLILMVGNEFQNRTLRQNVIDGQERNDIVTSKLILVLLFSLVSAVLVIFSGFIAGLFFADNSFSFDPIILKEFGIAFFAAIMQMLFALVFAFLVKRPAFSVILYLAYTVFVENILVGLFVWITKTKYAKLFFTQTADELTEFPLKAIKIEGGATEMHPAAPWIACVIYGALILFFLYRYINRTILK